MSIAIDFDDVVATFNPSYIDHHNKIYKTPMITMETATTFNMSELYQVPHKEIVRRVRKFCIENHDEMKLHKGVRDGLSHLSKEHDLHIVTSRCESLRDVTLNWMRQMNVLQYFTDTHFTNNFGSLYPERKNSKLNACRDIGAIALIEDSAGNAREVADGGIPVVLPEYKWNAGQVDDHPLIHIVPDWGIIPKTISHIQG